MRIIENKNKNLYIKSFVNVFMSKEIIRAASGLPFSKAIGYRGGEIIELSGQIGLDENGNLAEGIEEQTRVSFGNVINILKELSLGLSDLIKVRIFLVNMGDYGVVNKIYGEYFDGDFPARVALSVKELPMNALIELECTAFKE